MASLPDPPRLQGPPAYLFSPACVAPVIPRHRGQPAPPPSQQPSAAAPTTKSTRIVFGALCPDQVTARKSAASSTAAATTTATATTTPTADPGQQHSTVVLPARAPAGESTYPRHQIEPARPSQVPAAALMHVSPPSTCTLPPGKPTRSSQPVVFGLPEQPSVELPGCEPAARTAHGQTDSLDFVFPTVPGHFECGDRGRSGSPPVETPPTSGLYSVKDDGSVRSGTVRPEMQSRASSALAAAQPVLALPEFAAFDRPGTVGPVDLAMFYSRPPDRPDQQHDPHASAWSMLETAVAASAYSPGRHSSMMMDHVASLFGQSRFADALVDIHDNRYNQPFLSLPVHSAIVVVSPTLCNLLMSSQDTSMTIGPMRMVKTAISDPFITPDSFMSAVQFLYGIPPLGPHDFFKSTLHPTGRPLAAADAVGRALSYAAAGFVLQTPLVTTFGLSAAVSIVDWDSIDLVLEFALHMTVPGQLTYGSYSSQLLDSVIRFLVGNFPADFVLWTAAFNITGFASRFGIGPFSRLGSTAGRIARLGNIHFGHIRLDDGLLPTTATAVLSSILVACPVEMVRSVLSVETAKIIGRRRLFDLATQVVSEREKRRHHALAVAADLGRADLSGFTASVANALRAREQVVKHAHHPVGFVIDCAPDL